MRGGGAADTEWDAHSDIEANHTKMASMTDKPVAGLIKDLKRRGMLDSTIVNTAQVREAQPFDQGDQLLILRNGKRITTGRSYRKAVQEFLRRAT